MDIAIIGFGTIAEHGHLVGILQTPNVSLKAVVSRKQESAILATLDDRFGQVEIFPDLDSLLQSDCDIDLVIIATPDALHYEQAKDCLLANKHVLLEKPMTTDIEQAEELVKLAMERELVLATGFHLRSHAGHQKVKELLESGRCGAVRHVRASWAFPMSDSENWRTKEEMTRWLSLSAVGSHCIDLARWFSGDAADFRQLKAVATREKWGGAHDESAIIAAQFANGVTVEVFSSVQSGPYNDVQIFCDNGVIVCSDTLGRAGGGTIAVDGKSVDFAAENPFARQLQNVVSAINGGNLNAGAETGVRSVKDLDSVLAKTEKEDER